MSWEVKFQKRWVKILNSVMPKEMALVAVEKDSVPFLSNEDKSVPFLWKVSSAVFYAVCSFFITVINKSVLTSYLFPSFQVLAFGQMFTTVVVLYAGKKLGVINFPDFHLSAFSELSPLPFIYIGNMVFGLGGTKELSLPMFTMLRRFSILMTMIAEFYILGVRSRFSVKVSVAMMVLGAVIAAVNDLGFNLQGYVFVLLNDVLTASNGVYTKKILSSKEMGKNGVMYYCAAFMLPVSAILIWQTGDIPLVSAYPSWSNPAFLLQFLLSCCMGFILNYSVILCTQYNSALTTTIIGCLKNILVTYIGMFIGGDYIFSLNNFIGINLSVIGSLLYTYVTFRPPPPTRPLTNI